MFSTLRSVVGADNESTGATLMKKVMEDLDGKGNIVELLGPMGSDGQSVPREVIATNVVYTKENVNEILKK